MKKIMHEMEHDPLNPHSHEPNPAPPSDDPSFELWLVNGRSHTITPAILQNLPTTRVSECYIVSTGHGTTGPFSFIGARLLDLIEVYEAAPWAQAEIISDDGFGNRVLAEELYSQTDRPILLAYAIDERQMSRQEGLVRLIVPSEKDDALRQVKWVGRICIRP